MSYNLCNLPKQITAANGTSVKYSYFADGTKFKAANAAGNGFAYTGSLRWSVENGALFMVSERLKQRLEQEKITGITFEEYPYTISIDE